MTDATIVRGRWVVCGGGADDPVLTDGAVLIDGDTIGEVGPFDAVRDAHPRATVLGSDRVAVLPGLINAHHHSAGSTRIQHGVPDLLLESWLLAVSRVRAADVYLDTLLSAARLLGSGVTSVVDVLSGGGTVEDYAAGLARALAAYDEAGIRVAFAPGVATRSHIISGAGEDERFLATLSDEARADAEAWLPEAGRIDEDDYLGVMDGLCRDYAEHARIDVWYGPPGPQWVSDAFLQRIGEAAARHGVGIQTHGEESFYEKLHGQREYGKPTILHLRDLGVLGPRFSIAHGVWLTEPEIAVMAETGAAVSHNPGSNLRLRAGIAPLNAMLSAGVTVGLGMDGTTLNDDEDMFTEMRLALRAPTHAQTGNAGPDAGARPGDGSGGGRQIARQGGAPRACGCGLRRRSRRRRSLAGGVAVGGIGNRSARVPGDAPQGRRRGDRVHRRRDRLPGRPADPFRRGGRRPRAGRHALGRALSGRGGGPRRAPRPTRRGLLPVLGPARPGALHVLQFTDVGSLPAAVLMSSAARVSQAR